MVEDRVGRLEGEVNNLTSMVSEQQKVMKEIQEMLADEWGKMLRGAGRNAR